MSPMPGIGDSRFLRGICRTRRGSLRCLRLAGGRLLRGWVWRKLRGRRLLNRDLPCHARLAGNLPPHASLRWLGRIFWFRIWTCQVGVLLHIWLQGKIAG